MNKSKKDQPANEQKSTEIFEKYKDYFKTSKRNNNPHVGKMFVG